MGKLFGLILMLTAMYVGMTVYTEGTESAFGGILAPIQSADTRESPFATGLTPAAQMEDGPSGGGGRTPVTHRIRDKVTADMQRGAARRGY